MMTLIYRGSWYKSSDDPDDPKEVIPVRPFFYPFCTFSKKEMLLAVNSAHALLCMS